MALLRSALAATGMRRTLPMLVEFGFAGGRTGCRDVAAVLEVAAAIEAAPELEVAGLEGFEGTMSGTDLAAQRSGVDAYLQGARAALTALVGSGSFAAGAEVIATFGGSAFFDQVLAALPDRHIGGHPVWLVLRGGCYLLHDDGMYQRSSPLTAPGEPDPLRAAIEVWSTSVSCPEPGLAITAFGKRDASYDIEWPIARLLRRDSIIRTVTGGRVTGMNDQHAYLALTRDADIRVGDLLCCGISHPCTTFDKWALLPTVDDDDRVTGAIRSYF